MPATSRGDQRQSRRVLPFAGLLALACLAIWLHLQLPAWTKAADTSDSTPDCGNIAPEPYPLRERARIMAQLGVDRWHAAGYRGQGVKIAILDSGFKGYREHLGKALPAQVTARSFRSDGNLEAKDSQHGILCGEVIHALAPDAELLLANWEAEKPDQFLQAVQWARDQGAKIISCSLIMPSWSDGEGHGPVHATLGRTLGSGHKPGDMLCFASAGNTAMRHWSGTFHDGGNGIHEWETSHNTNELTPWGTEEQISVELCWQPGASYELAVEDEDTGAEVGRSTPHHLTTSVSCCAVVRFAPQAHHHYLVRVRLVAGEGKPFHLVALGGSLHYATAHGSIPFPGDGPEVIAVGAVTSDGQRASYSSCGPNSNQLKPDLVAPVPFPSLWRARPFAGTSAAAPQAAALAALWWSRNPNAVASNVREALQSAAHDLGPKGHDYETGYGLVSLP